MENYAKTTSIAIFFLAVCSYYVFAIIYLAVTQENDDKDMMAMFLLWIVPFIVIVGTILITGVIALLWKCFFREFVFGDAANSYEEI